MFNTTSAPQINHIVGRRERDWDHLDGWAPGYGAVVHDRRMLPGVTPGLVLIGLGSALFLAAWAHSRRDRD